MLNNDLPSLNRVRTPRTLRDFLFCSIVRSNQVSGEIYTTDDIEGGALFVSRGEDFSFERLACAIKSTARFKSGRSGFRRCINVCARLRAVHGRLAVGRHWYLMSLGIKPSKLGAATAVALVQPLLSRADADGVPCYLEVFRQTDLPFYKRLGFRIEGAGKMPGGRANFWAMLRLPQ